MVLYLDVFCKTGMSGNIRILKKTFFVCNFLTGSGFDQRSGAAAHFLTNVDGSTTCKRNTVNWRSNFLSFIQVCKVNFYGILLWKSSI